MKIKTIAMLIVLITAQLLEVFNDINILFYRLVMLLVCLWYLLYLMKGYKHLHVSNIVFVVIPILLLMFRSMLPFAQYFFDIFDNLPNVITIYSVSSISFIIPYCFILIYYLLIGKIYLNKK